MGKDPDMSKSMFKAGVTLKSDHAFQSFAQLISEHLLKRKHYKLSGLLLRALSLWRWAIGTSHAAPRALSLFHFSTMPLENLDTTPPARGEWPCSDPPSPMPGKHCSPGPHSHISCSCSQPATIFCLIHMVLAPCSTCLAHTCDHQWDSSCPTN